MNERHIKGGILSFVLQENERGEFEIVRPDCSEIEFDNLVRKHLMHRPAYTVIPDWQTLH